MMITGATREAKWRNVGRWRSEETVEEGPELEVK
jgi:hypothetical protein